MISEPYTTTMVDTAEASLRALGCRTRGQVEAALELWEWRPPLSRREMSALIARFQRARIVAEYCPACGETFHPDQPGTGARCQTCRYYGRFADGGKR